MQKLILVSSIIISIATLSCRKSTTPAPTLQSCSTTTQDTITYTGVVIHNLCGGIVIQTIAPCALGESGWTDKNEKTKTVTYDNVFADANVCAFGNYQPGDTIHFQKSALIPQNCMLCNLYVFTPQTKIPIKVVPK